MIKERSWQTIDDVKSGVKNFPPKGKCTTRNSVFSDQLFPME